jgi:hypothetical protein
MEAQSEPKPKRKYVMTPEHRAKVVANLAQARLAPKEKIYRQTPKRYAANLNNLGIANAKHRQDLELLRAKMKQVFPLPAVPPPPVPPMSQMPGDPPRHMPPSFFLDPFEQVVPLIAKRLRKVHRSRPGWSKCGRTSRHGQRRAGRPGPRNGIRDVEFRVRRKSRVSGCGSRGSPRRPPQVLPWKARAPNPCPRLLRRIPGATNLGKKATALPAHSVGGLRPENDQTRWR